MERQGTRPPTAKRTTGRESGVVFVTPQKGIIYQSCSLLKECSNNQAEYEALITGLEMALDMGISVLKVFGDSQLVIRQMNGIYEVRKPGVTSLPRTGNQGLNFLILSSFEGMDQFQLAAEGLVWDRGGRLAITIHGHYIYSVVVEEQVGECS